MTKKYLFGAMVALVAIAGFVIISATRSSDPIYRGKSLADWLDMQRLAVDGYDVPEADDALRAAGTNALPTLVRLIRARDSRFGAMLVRLSDLLHLPDRSHTDAPVLNLEGQHGFMVLGEAGSNAVPSLIKIYKANRSEFSKSAAAHSLAFIGPAAYKAVPVLLEDVNNRELEVRVEAIAALGGIHSAPQLVVPSLELSLRDSDESVRSVACRSLAKFKRDAAVPELIALLGDTSWRVRYSAVCALGEIGLGSGPVREALTKALNDPNETVRGTAAEALRRLGDQGTNATATPAEK